MARPPGARASASGSAPAGREEGASDSAALREVTVAVVLTLLIQASVSAAVFTPPVLAPVATPELGIGAASVGIATALIYLTATLSALASGGFIARLGPLRTSQGCLLLVGTGIALMAAGFVFTAALGALLIGLGYGAITPSSSAILNERTPSRMRALIFSVKQTGVPIGGALAGALIPPLMASTGWKWAAVLTGAASFAVAVLVQPGRAATDAGRDRSARLGRIRLREPIRLVWGHRPLRDMALASFTYSGMQMCIGSYLVVSLHEVARMSVAAAGAALASAMAGGIVGRIGWGIVADRAIPPRRLLGALGVGMAICAFCVSLVGAHWSWLAIGAFAFVFGATGIGWNGVYLSEVALVAPRGTAADATGGSLAFTYTGVVLLPLAIWAVVTAGFGYGAGFALIGVLTLWRALVFFRD